VKKTVFKILKIDGVKLSDEISRQKIAVLIIVFVSFQPER